MQVPMPQEDFSIFQSMWIILLWLYNFCSKIMYPLSTKISAVTWTLSEINFFLPVWNILFVIL